jgi:hypothetical protein
MSSSLTILRNFLALFSRKSAVRITESGSWQCRANKSQEGVSAQILVNAVTFHVDSKFPIKTDREQRCAAI